MLPQEIVRRIATFLPAHKAPVVELLWRPRLPPAFYQDLRRRQGAYSVYVSRRTGRVYHIYTRPNADGYVSDIARPDESAFTRVQHAPTWTSSRRAARWLAELLSAR